MSGNWRGQTELLAPAGQWESLRAAVANGADAVYFGLDDFNARRRAANFALDELPEVVRFVHDRNARAYVAMNTLIFPDELERAAEYVRALAGAGADAVIVQDLGLAALIGRMAPGLPVHASTQMTLSEPEAIAAAATLGVRRVILPRELSIDDIRRLRERCEVELEVFVHGALCVSYSGQCLASLSIGGRSANRGQCAQPCRLPYELHVDGRRVDCGGRDFLLSPRDLAAWDLLGELLAAGATAFKIEGRMKDAAYVAATVRMYRAALDAALAGRTHQPSREQAEALEHTFSRGFCRGYLTGRRLRELVDGESQAKRGRLLGVVRRVTNGAVVIELAADADAPAAGDGVAFDAPDPRDETAAQGGRVYHVRPLSGQNVELAFGREDVSLGALRPGLRAWKTDDPRLRRELEKTFARVEPYRREPLSVRVRAAEGAPLEATFTDTAGRSARGVGREPLAAARTRPLTTDLLRAQFGRLGDTPYSLGEVTLEGPSGPAESVNVMAPAGELNELRRRAVGELLAARRAAEPWPIAAADALETMRAEARGGAPASESPPLLCVLARTGEQVDAVLDWNAKAPGRVGLLYADLAEVADVSNAVDACRAAAVPVAPAGPRILTLDGHERVRRLAELPADAILARNLGTLRIAARVAPSLVRVGDFSLNVANELTAGLLGAWGLSRVAPGCDLYAEQLAHLAAALPRGALEVPIWRHEPMFHTQYCLWSAHLAGGAIAPECGRLCRRERVALRDRAGLTLHAFADES